MGHAFQHKATCMLMYSCRMREQVVMTMVHTLSHNPKQSCEQPGGSGKVAMTNRVRLLRQATGGIACRFQRKRLQSVAHPAFPSCNGKIEKSSFRQRVQK